MGLDIYMYRYLNKADTDKQEGLYNEGSKEIWDKIGKGKKYEDIPEKDKKKISKETALLSSKLGLVDGVDDKKRKSIRINSKKYPKHMFKIGYCRSSYNEGGINSVMRNLVGYDLYEVFGRNDDDEYAFQPDWSEVIKRAKKAIQEIKTSIKETGAVEVMKAEHNYFVPNIAKVYSLINSGKTALEEYKKVLGQERGFGSFSNSTGHYFLKEPLKVKAVIAGVSNFDKKPCHYLIYDAEDNLKFYIEALEIVIEMAQWVLKQEHSEQYWLHWSS